MIGADEQEAGRGRLDRTWVSDPGAGLWFSLVLDPTPGPLALAIGLGIQRGLRPWVIVDLKWPNDVLVEDHKLGGILIEAGLQYVVGIGLNLQTPRIQHACGLAGVAQGAWTPEEVLASVLRGVHDAIALLRTDPGKLLADYAHVCVTLGRTVQVELPDGVTLVGIAEGIDIDGHLLVKTDDIIRTVFAGDVIHATI